MSPLEKDNELSSKNLPSETLQYLASKETPKQVMIFAERITKPLTRKGILEARDSNLQKIVDALEEKLDKNDKETQFRKLTGLNQVYLITTSVDLIKSLALIDEVKIILPRPFLEVEV